MSLPSNPNGVIKRYGLLSLLLISVSTYTFGQTIVRQPYLQMNNPRAITIKWRTDVPVKGLVQWGKTTAGLNNPNNIKRETTATTEHEIRITGLNPNTKYFYAVGYDLVRQTTPGNEFHFWTSPSTGSKKFTRVWVLGDAGTDLSWQRDVRDKYYNYVGSGRTDLMLFLGDNAYDEGLDNEYQSKFFDNYTGLFKQVPIWPATGNHDLKNGNHSATTETAPYYNIFSLPKNGECGGRPSNRESYYSFDYANIHFIALESYELSRSPNGAMANWLRQDINNTNQDWVIAYWHHPPYSEGNHPSDQDQKETEMRQNILPVLEQAGVDMVLAGHSHAYERSYLLNGHYGASNTITQQMVLDNSSGKYTGPLDCPYVKKSSDGTVYMVCGSSGSNILKPSDPKDLDHPAMHVGRNKMGSVILEVEGNKLTGKFLSKSGNILDQWVIFKDVNLTKTYNICPGDQVNLSASWKGNYNWSHGANSRNVTVTPSTTTNYTVTDQYGCLQDVYTVQVNNPPNAGIPQVLFSGNKLCSNKYIPKVRLKNAGGGILNNVTIKYKLDNGGLKSYNWTGTLTSGSTRDITLPTYNINNGTHTFIAYTKNPNGCIDLATGNDDATITFVSATPDAGALTISNVSPVICGTTNISPKVTIKNFGNNVLSSLSIRYKIDNQNYQTQSWNGSLQAGGTTIINLPTLTTSGGIHTLTVQTLNPDNCNDINSSNDFKTISFSISNSVDAGIVKVNRPWKKTCGTDVHPRVTLKNYGSDTLFSLDINYQIDNGSWNSHSWNGKLAPGNIAWAYPLPAITTSNFRTHSFTAYSLNPNACIDPDNGNDTIRYTFKTINAPSSPNSGAAVIIIPEDTVQTNFAPEVIIKNYGTNNLISSDIIYQIDKLAPISDHWSGTIPSQGDDLFTFPNTTATPGAHNIMAYTIDPNGCNDINTNNDTVYGSFYVASNDANLLSFASPKSIENCTDTIRPAIWIQNNSNVNLKFIVLNYRLDSGSVLSDTISTTGPGLNISDSIKLFMPKTVIDTGVHQLKAWVSRPNDQEDSNTKNDTLLHNFIIDCNTISIRESDNEFVQTFPNPTNKNLTVVINLTSVKKVSVQLFDLNGKLVLESHPGRIIRYKVRLDMQDFANGTYLLKVSAGKRLIEQKVILKN